MSCRLCNRSGGPFCTGCRTVSRIKWLWEQRLGLTEGTEALAALRNCAGALTDLAEVLEASRRAVEEDLQRRGREVLGGLPAPAARSEKADLPGGNTPEKGGLVKPKEEVKSEKPLSPGEESEEETSKEEDLTVKPEAPVRPADKAEQRDKEDPQQPGREEPLGLKPLPQRLSSPDPVAQDGVRKSSSAPKSKKEDTKPREEKEPRYRRAEPSGRAVSSGHRGGESRRLASPEFPPGGWDSKRRDRSRSRRKRTSKGKKHRERGEKFRRDQAARRQSQWHQR